MRFPLSRGTAVAIALVNIAGCDEADERPNASSGAGPEGAGPAAAAANSPPEITALRLEPESPVAGEAVRVFATVHDPEGDPVAVRYAWTVDGRSLGADTPKLLLEGDATRGSVVSVSAVATDGRAESQPREARAELRNQPPVIERLLVLPSGTLTAGDDVEIRAEARDPDGDDIEIEYVWRVNDELVLEATGGKLATKQLGAGDRITVTVRASDGLAFGPAIEAPALRVENLPPRVVSRPGSPGPGMRFDYQIEVDDPDAEAPPAFELANGPEGMRVDPESGLVEWQPRRDQTGRHAVRVIVDDGQGARVAHDFEVELRAPPASGADS